MWMPTVVYPSIYYQGWNKLYTFFFIAVLRRTQNLQQPHRVVSSTPSHVKCAKERLAGNALFPRFSVEAAVRGPDPVKANRETENVSLQDALGAPAS